MAAREVIKFSELVGLDHTVTPGVTPHWLYHCPRCGDRYRTPKLYWNPKKQRGLCFRCEAVVVSDGELSLADASEFYLSFDVEALKPEVRTFTLRDWTWDFRESNKLYDYLVGARGFPEPWLLDHNVRACSSPYFGIVLPDNRGDECTMFQIRDQRPDPFLKYFNPSGCLKPLYGTKFAAGRSVRSVCLAEGVFSAWSAGRYTGKPAFATYGKTITTEQLTELMDLGVDEVELVYDGGEWYAFERAAERIQKVAVVRARLLPFKKDPNAVSQAEYLESPLMPMNEFAQSILHRWTKKYPANISANEREAGRLWDKIRSAAADTMNVGA